MPPSSPATSRADVKIQIRLGDGTEACTSAFLPRSFINSGTPQLGADPQRDVGWFFREQETHQSHKL